MTSLFFPLPFGDIVALSSGFYFSFEKIVISLIDVPLKVMSQFSLDALKTLVCRNFTIMSLIVSSFVLIQLGISSTSLISFISFGEKISAIIFFIYCFCTIISLHFFCDSFYVRWIFSPCSTYLLCDFLHFSTFCSPSFNLNVLTDLSSN